MNSISTMPTIVNTAVSNMEYVPRRLSPENYTQNQSRLNKENTAANFFTKATEKTQLKTQPWYSRILSDLMRGPQKDIIPEANTILWNIEKTLNARNYEQAKSLFKSMIEKPPVDFYSGRAIELLKNVILTNDLELIQFFCENINYHLVDLSSLMNGADLLEVACRLPHGSEHILSYLLRIGIKTATISSNVCPLVTACAMNNRLNVELLLSNGVKVNHCRQYQLRGETLLPLSVAIRNGNIDIVRTLINYGAYTNEKDESYKYSKYPLQLALLNHRFDIAELILSTGRHRLGINEPFIERISDRDVSITLLEYAVNKHKVTPNDQTATVLINWLLSHGAVITRKALNDAEPEIQTILRQNRSAAIGGKTMRRRKNLKMRKQTRKH